MLECPKCGRDNRKPVTQWTGGARTKKPMKVERFICPSCGTGYVAWLDSKSGEHRVMTTKG